MERWRLETSEWEFDLSVSTVAQLRTEPYQSRLNRSSIKKARLAVYQYVVAVCS